jgi:hypothetical protein
MFDLLDSDEAPVPYKVQLDSGDSVEFTFCTPHEYELLEFAFVSYRDGETQEVKPMSSSGNYSEAKYSRKGTSLLVEQKIDQCPFNSSKPARFQIEVQCFDVAAKYASATAIKNEKGEVDPCDLYLFMEHIMGCKLNADGTRKVVSLPDISPDSPYTEETWKLRYLFPGIGIILFSELVLMRLLD